jgi:myo-inositol-1(or 4)-monophosphatase
MQKSYSKELLVAVDAVNQAGEVLLDRFNRLHEFKLKEDNTEQLPEDIMSEKILVNSISGNFPKDIILTEESNPDIKESSRVWIFDPICGSYSYLRGVETWSISMALVSEGAFKVGVVYIPLLDLLFSAEAGKGLFLNGNKIENNQFNHINNAFISVEHAVFNSGKINILKLIKDIKRIRVGHGSGQELAYVASGRLDALIKTDQTAVHYSGGRALVEISGAKFYDFSGKRTVIIPFKGLEI